MSFRARLLARLPSGPAPRLPWPDVLSSGLFFAVLLSWSLALAPLGWLLWLLHRLTGWIGFRRAARGANWLYGRASLILLSPLVRVRRINPGEAVGRTPCIITVNHQSFYDLYLLASQDLPQICPVAKAWPFRLLFPFAPAMFAAGYVATEGREAGAILHDCRERLAENAALVVYPEGRRSRDGKLGRFHAGAFRLALDENVPIVPMIIKNSREIIRPGSFLLHPGAIEVELLPAVMPADYAAFRREAVPHRALMRHVRGLYERRLAEFAAGS